MADNWQISHRIGDNEYGIVIDWDEDSFLEGTPEIGVGVTVRRNDGPPRIVRAAVSIFAEEEEGAPLIRVSIEDQEILRMPLAYLLDESQVIDRIPGWLFGGDLLTGCLVRAGLSSVIRQVIRCKDETADLPWYRPRIQAIGSCIRKNFGRIGARTAFLAGRCVLRAGF